ncbi:hypothetical protein GCM10010990_36980 [Croceicoccus mobilis]|uniref:Uncharacterized protein n=1 Tax=Croceicoccus mobilis TaxID=1703339 RepID=A0A917DYZ4_9SPHN|nr:hypothetical protein GCM10010990_36980 [Croceicoccus mobilis]
MPIAAIALGYVLSSQLLGEEWFKGFMLFILGLSCGDLLKAFTPTATNSEGPAMAWDEMYASDRLAYFLPAITLCVAGFLAVIMASQLSHATTDWGLYLMAVVVLASGFSLGFQLWANRKA